MQTTLPAFSWQEPVIQEPPNIASADQHRLMGNAELASRWLLPAERSYTIGLKLEPEYLGLRLNRALVRLKLGLFRAARADAEAVLALGRARSRPDDSDRAASGESSLPCWLGALLNSALVERREPS